MLGYSYGRLFGVLPRQSKGYNDAETRGMMAPSEIFRVV